MSRRSIMGAFAVVGLSIVLVAAPGVARAQAPGNDDVGSARGVTAIPFTDSVPTGEATVEDGEPTETCAPFGNTVWYAVTLPATTDVYVDTAGSNYDTTVAVWTGSSFADVELVACNDDTFSSLQAAAGFTAAAGVTYLVQIGAFFSAPPDASLTLRIGPPPKPTGKPYISSGGIRGSSADAYVDTYDEATGTYSSRSIQLLDGSVRSKGARPSNVSQVALSSFEERYDETDGSFTWTEWFGYADLQPGQFSIDRQLRNARVGTELTLFGQTCTDSPAGFGCDTLGEIDVVVDTSWTGNGPVARSQNRGSDEVQGARFRYRSNVTSRSATLSGGAAGVPEVAGVPELDFTGVAGTISNGADGYWSWIRPGTGAFGGTAAMAMLAEQIAPAGAQVDSGRFRGSYANAVDEAYDEETGTYSYRDVTMNIGESRSRTGRWMPADDNVSVYSSTQSYNDVDQTVTTEEWFGSGPLESGSVGRKLDTGSARAEIEVWGLSCTYDWAADARDCVDLGQSMASVAVDWTGVGTTSTSTSSSSYQVDGQHVRFSGRSSSRAAIANGAITGAGGDWTLVDASGSMGRNAEGYWTKY